MSWWLVVSSLELGFFSVPLLHVQSTCSSVTVFLLVSRVSRHDIRIWYLYVSLGMTFKLPTNFINFQPPPLSWAPELIANPWDVMSIIWPPTRTLNGAKKSTRSTSSALINTLPPQCHPFMKTYQYIQIWNMLQGHASYKIELQTWSSTQNSVRMILMVFYVGH